MFNFLWRKEDPFRKLYPSFQARLFATLVDTALAVLLLIPLFTLFFTIFYRDIPPSKRLSVIMSRVSKQANNFESLPRKLNKDPEYRQFIEQHGYKSIMIEQGIQVFLFGFAVLIFWFKWHATPGKILLSMKIVDEKTLKPPSSYQLIVRLCSCIISFIPLGFGLFYIALNRKRRAWHDIISGTIVIKKKELEKSLTTAKV